jgi:phosphoribosylformylglycinamidine synthase
MAFAGGWGIQLDLRMMPQELGMDRDDTLLYAETASRFVVTVPPQHRDAFRQIMQACAIGEVGTVLETPDFLVVGQRGDVVVRSDISALKEAWQQPLRWS